MPSKSRWALNPRRWFGSVTNTPSKHDKNNPLPPPPSPPRATTTTTRTIPRLPTAKNKMKVIPTTFSYDVNNNTASNSTPIRQLQLPAFSGVRREKLPALLPSAATFYRFNTNTFLPAHTEPTIRKNGRLDEELTIDTTRWNTQSILTTIYDIPRNKNSQKHTRAKQTEMSVSNMSHRCLIDYPRHSPTTINQSSLPTRSSSSSLIDDNDNSSSSGIYTDERQCTDSKETLEVRSIESIVDSQTSFNQAHIRPVIHHHRRPMSVVETMDDKSQSRQTSVLRSHRSHSAEDILQDNQTIKSRQSSANIMKKIEKRIPTIRSPTGTLEKVGFRRIANDTYTIRIENDDRLYQRRHNSIHSFVQYSNLYDDSLRPAHDEERYATLPRTSSTEQLDNNIQNDLRIIVDECIRPMITSIGKSRLTKPLQNRYKRTHINNEQKKISIEDITDKLLSSIDYSIYAQYQRCC